MKPNPLIEKIVYFVRHGQSNDNVAPVFQALDSPLSEEGLNQAKFIAARISKVPFDKLISSPLQRTQQTAQEISETANKPIIFSDLFVERVKPSSISGKPYTDTKTGQIWRDWEESLVSVGKKVENGENYQAIIQRADKALEYLYQQSEKTLVVVTHGYFLRTLVARVLLGDTLTPESFKNFQKVASMENTGITVLTHEGAFEQDPCWRLWIYNDHAHLAE